MDKNSRQVSNIQVHNNSQKKSGYLARNTSHHMDHNKNDLGYYIGLYKHDEPPRHSHKIPHTLVHPRNHILPLLALPLLIQIGYSNLSGS